MGWVWRPFGPKSKPDEAKPSSALDTLPAPVEEPEAAPPPVSAPDVPRGVQHAAEALAEHVWSVQVASRAELLPRINPPDADRYVAHAVAMGWILADGDRLTKGPVSPRQPDQVAEGSGGWDSLAWR